MSKIKEWVLKHKIISIIIFILVIGAIAGGSSNTNNKPSESVKEQTKVQEQKQPEQSPQLKYAFDVPSLVGKNIDEVRTVLGTPSNGKLTEPTQEQLNLGASEWDNTFKKDGKELLATFNPSTRQIVDFFISTDDSSGKTQDKNHLLELGNLKGNDSKYKVEFVKVLGDQSSYTGVKVMPNK